MQDFVHLHVHTQYSILDGQASVSRLVDKAMKDGMRGMAITDHGNMMAIKEFFNYTTKKNSGTNADIKMWKKRIALLENGEDAALKALLHQHGDPAGMVDMGVGDEHEVDAAGMEGQGFVVYLVPSLLQAAVDQDVFAVDLQTVTAAGHALVSAVKAQLHNGPPSFFVRVFRVVLLLRSS